MKSDDEQLNKVVNEGLYQVPNKNQVLQVHVSKVDTIGTVCQNADEEWTSWRSVTTGADDDLELLLDHQKNYRFPLVTIHVKVR